MVMYSLTMRRGKKLVFIGLFPSLYRVDVVECNLEWDPCWKPIIEQKEVHYDQGHTASHQPQATLG
jgi:hypothetical protein